MKKMPNEVAAARGDYTHLYLLSPGDVLHVNGVPVAYIGGGYIGTNTVLPDEPAPHSCVMAEDDETGATVGDYARTS